MANKKIGIIGSGAVAQTLAAGLARHGFDVIIGSRDVGKLNKWKEQSKASIATGSFEETARFGEMIILAVKGTAAEALIKQLESALRGKTVIDTTNPIGEGPPDNGVLKFFTTLNESLMERLQVIAPQANFVKAFSCVGNSLMIDPKLSGGKPTMFICGNGDHAKKETQILLNEIGWEWADMGKVQAARAIEPLCILWCIPGFLQNDWVHAFKLLRP